MPSPKRYKLRTSAVVALAVLFFSVAAVGVSAYEPCQRFVQKYVEKVVPHHYSKATLARWAQWGKEHPNYHPPKRRPKLQPQEALDKVNFDCEIPPEPTLIAGLLQPEPFADDLPLIPELVAINTAPPVTPRPVSLVDVPVKSPLVDTLPTPEPHSGILVLTGILFIFMAFGLRAMHLKEDLPSPLAAV